MGSTGLGKTEKWTHVLTGLARTLPMNPTAAGAAVTAPATDGAINNSAKRNGYR